ncbi:hypothetical protein K2X40_00525 [Candidatus Babeliales bacterium]|nr:hypothetical protein [Candidatus Babeliales bacterium]
MFGIKDNFLGAKKRIRIFFRSRKRSQLRRSIQKINQQVDALVKKIPSLEKKQQKILFALSFSFCEVNRIHDWMLAQALKLRGAKVVALVEGVVQEGETSVLGGIWGSYNDNPEHNRKQFEKNSKLVQEADTELWQQWLNIVPFELSQYISENQKNIVRQTVEIYNLADYASWNYDAMPVGRWIIDIIKNNELVGDIECVINYEKKLRAYLFNIILMIEALNKALDDINPDVIYSNGSFYYPWSIIKIIAARKNIPYFNSTIGYVRNTWCYNFNADVVPTDFSRVWQGWRDRVLSENEKLLVEEYLKKGKTGVNMNVNTANPASCVTKVVQQSLSHIDFSKPTFLLPINIIWDAAALEVPKAFGAMPNWLEKVINFFKNKPEYNLILKTHPGEWNKYFPITRQGMYEFCLNLNLTRNIVCLRPDTNIQAYDLFDYITAGLVFTTTLGIEMACAGVPVVTLGHAPYAQKGFTYDPKNYEEYFSLLEALANNSVTSQERLDNQQQARKFLYLYHFIYSMKFDLFDYSLTGHNVLNFSNADALRPGNNKMFDYVCDSIINHWPIISEDRWPNF